MNDISATAWLTSPEMNERLERLRKMRIGPFVLRKPDGQWASDNFDLYGPWMFDTMESAENMARAIESDYDWPIGSVEVRASWEAGPEWEGI